jgi:hypothetical protein
LTVVDRTSAVGIGVLTWVAQTVLTQIPTTQARFSDTVERVAVPIAIEVF